jgi:hypothetical protein
MISGLPSIRAYLGFLIRHLREFAILCADNIVYTLSRGGTPDPGKCLLVRLDAIGDYILWSDAAKATKAHLARKDVAVVLLANELWADLAAPEFDEICTGPESLVSKKRAPRTRSANWTSDSDTQNGVLRAQLVVRLPRAKGTADAMRRTRIGRKRVAGGASGDR